jgi:hypothetical protein
MDFSFLEVFFFTLSRSGLKPKTFRTRRNNVNHHTADNLELDIMNVLPHQTNTIKYIRTDFDTKDCNDHEIPVRIGGLIG